MKVDLFFSALQLIVEVCDTWDAAAVDILLRRPQEGIALKAYPSIVRLSPDTLIKKDFSAHVPLESLLSRSVSCVTKTSIQNSRQK